MGISVDVENLSKRYANGTRALDRVTLEVAAGSILAVVGPSGSGKSTLLRLIAGLDQPTSGSIRLDGVSVKHVPPWRRRVAWVGQTPALFPHLSVERNLALGLRGSPWTRARREQRLHELAELLRIGDLLKLRPMEISGGERQRVALGRALAPRRPLLLLDEPFASLDTPLRHDLRDWLISAQSTARFTMIVVTHDPADALALGRQVAVLDKGSVAQVDHHAKLRTEPRSTTVARFSGEPPINLLQAGPDEILAGAWSARQTPDSSRSLLLGIRPEHICFLGPGASALSDDWIVEGLAEHIQPIANTRLLTVRVGNQSLTLCLAAEDVVEPEARVRLRLDRRRAVWFDARSGMRVEPP